MQTTVQRLKRALEHDIVSQHFKPGDRLDESGLAERFQTSRTPVREALRLLAASGLVELRPRRGAVVARLGLQDVIEMFEVMGELEGMCGRLAAIRASGEELTTLEEAQRVCVEQLEAGDIDGYYEANVRFHEIIYAASHNRFLATQTRSLRNRLAPYRRLQLESRNRPRQSSDEHGRIVEAIRDSRADDAEVLLRDHVTRQSASLADFLNGFPRDALEDQGPELTNSAST